MRYTEFRESLKGKNIMVVGMGKSGKAATEVLAECGAVVTCQDASDASRMDSGFLKHLEEIGAKTCFGRIPEDLTGFDMLVLSPGVPSDLDYIREAEKAGAEIIGELELAYRLTPARFAAITGTNGKTTTTTLTGEIFKAAGRKTHVVGNIGNPVVTDAVMAGPEDWMVTEVSSFQLETVREFRPVVSAILNLTPDHLNRHKTMEAYGNAKANVAARQTEDEYLVVNYDDPAVMALTSRSKATVIPFSRKSVLDHGAYLDGTSIVIRDTDGSIHYICDKGDLRIIGDHNVENVLAASAVCYFAGIDEEVIGKAVREFPGVEHRIEFCGRAGGVDYYNDSKGTNVDAAVIAIKALENNIILIAGGDGKSQDFTDLAEHLRDGVIALVLLGRDAPVIEEAARKAGYENIYHCRDMEECVRKSSELAREGDKVLLSPACASWDMYPNYEVRGRHFKQCVKDIIEIG